MFNWCDFCPPGKSASHHQAAAAALFTAQDPWAGYLYFVAHKILYTATLGRTASVVGKRSNVDNLSNLDTHAVHGTDC